MKKMKIRTYGVAVGTAVLLLIVSLTLTSCPPPFESELAKAARETVEEEQPRVPLAPSDLEATAISASQIELTWSDNSDNEKEFQIQKKIGGSGDWQSVKSVGADSTAYSDMGLSEETQYTYRVRSENQNGNSAWSNEATKTTFAIVTNKITYNGNGYDSGKVPLDENEYEVGEIVTISGPGTMSLTGFNFIGWNTTQDGSGTNYEDGFTFAMPDHGVMLYAQWSVKTYTLSYDGNGSDGGTVPAGGEYDYEETVTAAFPGTLSLTGHSFTGWNTAQDGSGTRYEDGSTFSMPDHDVTFYAQWSVKTYTLIYDGNENDGGMVPAGGEYDYGETVTAADPGTISLTGHEFTGWNTSQNGFGTSYWIGSTFDMPDHDLTLYAQWSVKTYTLRYDGNENDGGTVPTGDDYDYWETVTAAGPGTMSLTGHEFTGWNTVQDGSGNNYEEGSTFAMPANDLTLYANWETSTGTKTTERTLAVSFDLRYIQSGDYYVGDEIGTYDYTDNANVILTNGYWIAETEVTYELWYIVRNYAERLGYTFANKGREGDDGIIGDSPNTGDDQEPVTEISWRDAMIWCNALSESQGLTPVYYTDSEFSTPIREVTGNSSLDTTAGHEDNPYVKWNADGYRLPTEAEWEIAARGADLKNDYGTRYSGSETAGDVAWYMDNCDHTKDVATKNANEIGLYDMSGNTWEWTWDWYTSTYPYEQTNPSGPPSSSNPNRMVHGGSWHDPISFCTVKARTYIVTYGAAYYIGFRPVRIGD